MEVKVLLIFNYIVVIVVKVIMKDSFYFVYRLLWYFESGIVKLCFYIICILIGLFNYIM